MERESKEFQGKEESRFEKPSHWEKVDQGAGPKGTSNEERVALFKVFPSRGHEEGGGSPQVGKNTRREKT